MLRIFGFVVVLLCTVCSIAGPARLLHNCRTDADCGLPSGQLFCSSRRCYCKSPTVLNVYWDSKGKAVFECLTKSTFLERHRPCSRSNDCHSNGTCVYTSHNYMRGTCRSGLYCRENQDFLGNWARAEDCLGYVGGYCDWDVRCFDGASCEQGKCKCVGPSLKNCVHFSPCDGNKHCKCPLKYQIFDPSQLKCVWPVHAPCDQTRKGECVKNAACESGPPGHEPKCTCHQGFRDELSGLCVPLLGSPCDSSKDCRDKSETFDCASGGVCGCRNGTMLDEVAGSCRVLLGQRCEVEDNMKESFNHKPVSCVPNSVCVSTSGDSSGGICSCKRDYERLNDFTCNQLR